MWARRRKYIFLLIPLILLITFAGVAYQHFASPNTTDWKTKLLHVPGRNNLGIDYYHESMGYLKRTPAEVTQDLGQIQQVSQNIKVYHNPFTPASLPLIKSIVQQAKSLHMHVVWVENADTVVLTDASWKTYTSHVTTDAAEAAKAGADEFLVGNEISIHNNGDPGFSDLQLPARVKQLATDCHTNFSGPIGYEEGWYKSVIWQKATLGPLSHIYFTLYEPWYRYKVAFDGIVNAFGNKAEIGELSSMSTMQQLNYTEEDWTRELLRRYEYARQKGLIVWLFNFADFSTDGFGLFRPDTYQPHAIWAYLRGQKTLSYHELPLHFSDVSSNPGAQMVGDNGVQVGEFTAPVLVDTPVTDYVFHGTISPLSASGKDKWRATRLVFRYNDNQNYYFLDIEPEGHKIQLFRRQNGTEVNLGSQVTDLQYMQKYNFELRVSGSGTSTHLQVFWDTVKVFDIHDKGNTNLASGSVGMKNNGVTAEMDDLVLTDFERNTTK